MLSTLVDVIVMTITIYIFYIYKKNSVIVLSLNKTPHAPLFQVFDSNFNSWSKTISKVNGNHERKITYVCAEYFLTRYAILKSFSAEKEKLGKVRMYIKHTFIVYFLGIEKF